MINFIQGIISEKIEQSVIVEANGLGYECFVSNQTLSVLSVGQSAKILTYLKVSDDGLTLYGFIESAERAMFLRLISVSGVGAKVALSVLSGMNIDRLVSAVASGDIVMISSIKGIGKKTAERIVLELKDKIINEFLIKQGGDIAMVANGSEIVGSLAGQAVEALVALGYSKSEATNSVSKIKDMDGLSVEDIIVKALRN
ncbi:MAG: Holliday junction branch migration protein RuvA [Firmicutes bacterium]|nr:Holliday junction branch migration protein RuvA [Bacillota bacterium]